MFSLWCFIRNENEKAYNDDYEIDVLVDIESDGTFEIREITAYTEDGNPYFVEINTLSPKNLKIIEDKVEEKHTELSNQRYFENMREARKWDREFDSE